MSNEAVHPEVTFKPPPGGAAYYNRKAPTLPAHLTQKRRRKRRTVSCNPGRCCLSSLCSILVILIVIIGIAALVFWLADHPKSPHYSVDSVRILGLDPKSLNSSLTSGIVNPETRFSVVARNPNQKLGFSYDDINVNIEVLGVTIGSGTLPPFYQGHKNTTVVTGDLKAGPLNINDFSYAGLLRASRANKVPLVFNVEVKARVKVGSWKSWKFKVQAHCSVTANPNTTIPTGTTDESCSSKFKMW